MKRANIQHGIPAAASRCMKGYGDGCAALLARYPQYCLTGAVLFLYCFIYREYFFFQYLFLFDRSAVDTISQFYPIEFFRVRHALDHHVPFWSFQFGLGENVYKLATGINPFNVLYWFFGPEHFSEIIFFDMLLKFLSAALFFHAFLQKIGCSAPAAFIGALAYTFSGHMIINSHWYHYANYVCFAAMFLYFFELWFQNCIWLPLVMLMGLVSIKLEFTILQLAFFGFFYVFYRCVNAIGFDKKTFFCFIRLAALYGLGLLVWSYFLFPDLYGYFYSARVQGAASGITDIHFLEKVFQVTPLDKLVIVLARFFSPDALSSWLVYNNLRSVYFEDSSMYVGIAAFALFLVPFFWKGKNGKLLWIFPCIVLFLLIFPFFRLALTAFITPSFKHISLYFGFYALFPAILILDSWLNRETRTDHPFAAKMILCATYLVLFVLFVYIMTHKNVGGAAFNRYRIFISFMFLTCFVVLLLLHDKYRSNKCRTLLYCLIVAELVVSARVVSGGIATPLYPFFERRHDYYYNTETKQAINSLHDQDKEFFRIEKNYFGFGLNDAMIQGYFGTKAYLGFPSKGLRDFYTQYGLKQSVLSYHKGLEGNKRLQDLLLVKYFLCKDGTDCGDLSGFAPLRTFGDVRVYRNEGAHDFGRMFYRRMPPDVFEELPMRERHRAVPDIVVGGEDVPGVARTDGVGDEPETSQRDAFRLASWTEERFVGDIEVTRPGILFFPIPYDIGWQARVDGEKTPLLRLNYAFFGLPMTDLGRHHVELRYRPPFMALGWVLTAVGLLITFLLWRRYPRIAPY